MPLERRKPFKKVSEKKMQRLNTLRQQWDQDAAFYTRIWEARAGRCQITGQLLGLEPLKTMFHHILPKAKYPQYRYCAWNIILVHPDIHATVESDQDKVPQIRARFEELLVKHRTGVLCACS